MSKKETEAVVTVEEENQAELKDKKAERFFAHMHEITDFMITVYKQGEKGKKVTVAKFENIVPDEFSDIRDVYGEGTYHLYCHQMENGRLTKLLDYCTVHLGGALKPDSSFPIPENLNPQNQMKGTLELIAGLKAIIGNNDSTGLTEFVKMQAEITQTQNQMMLDMSTKLMQMQVDAEKRFSTMIEKMSNKNDSVENILKTVELIETLKGSSSADKPIWEKLLSSPLAEPLIQSLFQGQNTDSTSPSQPTQQIPAPSPLSKKEKIQVVFNQIPDDVKKQFTDENKSDVIKTLHERNKKLLTLDETIELVNKILIYNKSNQTEDTNGTNL